MKKKIISIILIFALLLTGLQMTVMADTIPTWFEGVGRPAPYKEGNYIFANGYNLYIVEGHNGGTAIYYMRKSVPEYLNESGSDGDDCSKIMIYGGGDGVSYGTGDFNSDNAASDILMYGGNIGGISGGNMEAPLEGDTHITIEDGTVGTIFGGGYLCKQNGNSYITIEGGNIGSVHGGGNWCDLNNSYIDIKGGKVKYVTGAGGGNESDVQNAYLYISEDAKVESACIGDGHNAVNVTAEGFVTSGDLNTDYYNNLIWNSGNSWTVKGNAKVPSGYTMTVEQNEIVSINSKVTSFTNNGTIVNNGTITSEKVLNNNGTIVNKGTINLFNPITGNNIENKGTINRYTAYIENAPEGTPAVWVDGNEYALSDDYYERVDGNLYLWLNKGGNVKVSVGDTDYYGVHEVKTATKLTSDYVIPTDITGLPDSMKANTSVELTPRLEGTSTLPFKLTVSMVGNGEATASTLTGNTLYSGKGGTVTLKVTATDGYTELKKEQDISVIYTPVEDLTGDVPDVMIQGSKDKLPVVNPPDASYTDIQWTVSDSSIASIVNGVLTAHKAGTVTVTASIENGKVYGEIFTKEFIIAIKAVAVGSALDIDAGDITISDESADYYRIEYAGYTDGFATVKKDEPIVITGTTTEHGIIVKSGSPKIVLNGVNISNDVSVGSSVPVSVESGATLDIVLMGVNTIASTYDGLNSYNNTAIYTPKGASLIIGGEGTLNVSGGRSSAGIGSYSGGPDVGNITINSGTIVASGRIAAAIGSNNTDAGNITINGGHVSAPDNEGILLGSKSGRVNIVINDGTIINHVESNAGYCSIGGVGGQITINGGYVDVSGGGGAAIGSSSKAASGVDVTINGGKVKAGIGEGYGAAIGGGREAKCGNITINGGEVTATGSYGAAIGSGSASSNNPTINISGGIIYAESIDGHGGAAIGGGSYIPLGSTNGVSGGNINIYGGYITAQTDGAGAPIGGGFGTSKGGAGGNITINGGTVVAHSDIYAQGQYNSNHRAAAIGGGGTGSSSGTGGDGGNVVIVGGNVQAIAPYNDVIGPGNARGASGAAGTLTNGSANGANDVSLKTLTLNGVESDNAKIQGIEGLPSYYNLKDVKLLDTNKLYLYLPEGTSIPSITVDGKTYYDTDGDGTYDQHVHSWVYSAEANKITVKCANTDLRCDKISGGNVYVDVTENTTYTGEPVKATVTDNLSDLVTEEYAITYSSGTAPVNAGNYTVTLSLGDASVIIPFNIEKAPTNAKIEVPDITYGNSIEPKVTAGTGEAAGVITYSSYGQGNTKLKMAGITSEEEPTEAGTYRASYVIPESTNYRASSASTYFTINPYKVTVTPAAGQNKTYGDADPTLTFTHTATIGSDRLSGVLTRVEGKAVGRYAYTLDDLEDNNPNYDFALDEDSDSFEITKRNVTLTPVIADKQYDGKTDAMITSVGIDNSVQGDNLSVDFSGVTAKFTSEDVGNDIAVTFTGEFKLVGNDAGNYMITGGQPISSKANIYNDFNPTSGTEYTVTTPNEDGWVKEFVVEAEDGYKVSFDGVEWKDKITFTEDTDEGEAKFFVKDESTGAISVETTEEYMLDNTAPTGKVTIKENFWKNLLENISFGLFYNEDVDIVVKADDALSGVAGVYYIDSETAKTKDQLDSADNWTQMTLDYTISVPAKDEERFIYYFKIVDKAYNISYISTDGVEFDTSDPVISGVANNGQYYGTQVIIIEDKNLDKYLISEASIELLATGQETEATGSKEIITFGETGTYALTATDKAGNSEEITFTVKSIASIDDAYEDIENVTSDNKKDIEDAKAKAEDSLQKAQDSLTENGDNLTDEEKEAIEQDIVDLQDIVNKADELIDIIEDAEDAANTDAIENAKDITKDDINPENKSEIKEDLQDAIDDINDALDNFGDNYTDEERQELEEEKARLEDLVDDIIKAEEIEDLIEQIPDELQRDDMDDVKDAQEAFDQLDEDQKDLISDEDKQKLEDATTKVENAEKVEELIEQIPDVLDKDDIDDVKDTQDAFDKLTDEEKNLITDEDKQKLEDATSKVENAENAEDLIDKIPDENLTDEDVDKIKDAQDAFDNLTDEEKNLISDEDKEKLEDASQKVENIEEVEDLIEQIPDILDKDDIDDVKDAQDAFDNLTDEEKDMIPDDLKDKLEDASTKVENAENAEDLIDKIPDKNLTDEDVDKIKDAQDAFDNLTDEEKNLISDEDKEKLEDASEKVENVEKVEDLIDQIPDENLTDEDIDKIKDAQDAFDNLTDEEKNMITDEDKEKLEDASEKVENAEKVEDLIDKIPDVLDKDDIDDVKDAQDAFDNLTDEEKDMIPDDLKDKLEDASTKVENAENAENLIDKIPDGNLTDEDVDKIKDAQDAFDNLTDEEKNLIPDEDKEKLEDASQKVENIEKVEDLIDKIPGTLNKDDIEGVKDAQEAFDKLTDEEKEMIPDELIDKLEDAFTKVVNVENVEALINVLPNLVTPDDAEDIKAAWNAYSNLTDEEKSLLDAELVSKLIEANEKYGVPFPIDKTNLLFWGGITLACLTLIFIVFFKKRKKDNE